jgi:hypothetical protein
MQLRLPLLLVVCMCMRGVYAAWRAPRADAASSSQGSVSGPDGSITTRWRFRWPDSAFRAFGTPVALLADDAGSLYAADVGIPEFSNNTILYSLATADGSVRWSVNISWSWDGYSSLLLVPTEQRGDVLVGRVSGYSADCPTSVHGWDIGSGVQLWRICPFGTYPTFIELLPSAAGVLVPLSNGTTLVLNAATGEATSSAPWGAFPWDDAILYGAATKSSDGKLLFAVTVLPRSGGGNLTVIDVASGRTLWSTLSAGADGVLAVTSDGALVSFGGAWPGVAAVALNATDGTALWSTLLPPAFPIGVAASRQGPVWMMQIDNANNTVFATVLNGTTGAVVGNASLPAPPDINPTGGTASYTIALAANGRTAYGVVWWDFPDPANGEVIYAATLPSDGSPLALSAVGAAEDDSSYLALGGDGTALYASGCYGVYAYA